jgi:hypothetical protein
MRKRLIRTTAALILLLVLSPVLTSMAGAQKVNIHDNTQDGLQPGDPVIGFVVLNQDANGRLIIEVSLKKSLPYENFTVELVTVGNNTDGGINQFGHYGFINMLGVITTNKVGNGNAHFTVDPTTLLGVAPGVMNYGHLDIEDYIDLSIGINQYGSAAVSWMQP